MRAQYGARRAGLAVVGVLVAVIMSGSGPAAAATSPLPDPALAGPLTLCSAAGQQITSGSTTAQPAVARAVAGSAAPVGYRRGGTATLYAFQPRPSVPATDWSGEQLTASSRYSNATHPIAVGTSLDESVATYLSDYPLASSGVFELRTYLGAPGQPELSTTYDGSFIQVSGTSWRQLEPGPDDCSTAGTAVSLETLTLPAKTFGSASPSDRHIKASGVPAASISPPSAAGHRAGAAQTAISNAEPAADATTSGTGRNLTIGLCIAGLAGACGIAFALRRRRTSAATHQPAQAG